MSELAVKRYYRLEEVNACVADLGRLFSAVMQLRSQLRMLYHRLEAAGCAPVGNLEQPPNVPAELRRDYSLFVGLAEVLKEQLDRITQTGCVIKDLDIGLVDWLACYHGREIWLCWKYGEQEVAFWHELRTGFAGRRPVSELTEEHKPPLP